MVLLGLVQGPAELDNDVQADGTVSVAITAPDTITSWSLAAFATGPTGIAAATAPKPLRVFKPLFIEARLPYSAVRGEDLEVIVVVYNYVGVSAATNVTLITSALEQQLLVPDDGFAWVILHIEPTSIGSFPLKVTARTPSNVGHADALQRFLLVKPEGEEVAVTRNAILELVDGGSPVIKDVTLLAPGNAIDGSVQASISLVGDLMGPSLNGLERLLRIPSGCGEQNMISLAPNVYVGKYLTAAGRLRPDVRQRITRNMLVGYGRELTYMHADGSFSAFGEQDREGSTWLTAFVVRVFAEVHALGFIVVDLSVLEVAANWLVNLQTDDDGDFLSRGSVIHQEMMGGLGSSSGGHNHGEQMSPDNSGRSALTSFVVLALAKARSTGAVQSSSLETALVKAANFLHTFGAPTQTAAYASVLRSYSLLIAGQKAASEAVDEVLSIAQAGAVSGEIFWSNVDGELPQERGRTRALDVELTGYGVLVLVEAGRLTKAFEAVRWLLDRRSAGGGFVSTQDTVVALGALAKYAEAVGNTADLSVRIRSGSLDTTVDIDSSNYDVMQTHSVTPNETVSVEASGRGMALATAELRYNLPERPEEPCFDVDVKWFRAVDDAARGSSVRTCIVTRPTCAGGGDGMAIVSLGLYTGYEPAPESLQERKAKGDVKRAELGDRRVELYLDEGKLRKGSPSCIDIGVRKVFNVRNLQPTATQVYAYYETDLRGSTNTAFDLQAWEPAPNSIGGDGSTTSIGAEISTTATNSIGGGGSTTSIGADRSTTSPLSDQALSSSMMEVPGVASAILIVSSFVVMSSSLA